MLWFAGYWLVTLLYGFFGPGELLRSLIAMHLNLAWLILFLWTGSVLLREERLLRTVLVSLITATSLMTLGNLVGVPGFIDQHGTHYVRTGALGWGLDSLGLFLGFVALVAVGLLLDRARWKRWRRGLLLGSLILVLCF